MARYLRSYDRGNVRKYWLLPLSSPDHSSTCFPNQLDGKYSRRWERTLYGVDAQTGACGIR
ncbi:hypothetical protein KSF_093400 [Reticulibacter mediterranei]|uniref:Uncharacterized protein n=1 Tax=Reticulibacter mediterranei TaxID=2778369 RepID=A0A8J3N5H5_9CHLR|nr:hypothetical protein KSF_093400 [Reticulibacter mediterranei]